MKREAIVVSLSGRDTAVVSVTRQSMCGETCGVCRGCLHPLETIETEALNEIGALPGDRVEITSSSAQSLKIAALVYFVPLLLFIIGYIIHPLVGALALIGGFFAAFYTNRRIAASGGVKVVITAYAEGSIS
ncbi:MAG: SoxR reducing system RseC family protein [Oscillospiraceae bacterium]|jgi:sigma-E factor negative regulatory protein RseC|nr:SoxR reducing system RseC family protein [Oscillospiraceae bacterium]